MGRWKVEAITRAASSASSTAGGVSCAGDTTSRLTRAPRPRGVVVVADGDDLLGPLDQLDQGLDGARGGRRRVQDQLLGAVGQLAYGVDHALAVRRDGGAEALEVGRIGRAGRGDHSGAEIARYLHRAVAHHAAGAMDQHGRAGADRVDRAGDVAADSAGQWPSHESAQLPVGGVEPGGGDPDAHGAGGRVGDLGALLSQHVERLAVLVEPDGT